MQEKSVRWSHRVGFLILCFTALSCSGGEVIENPKNSSLGLQRPELDPKFLRRNAPVVSVLLVEENQGARLASYSKLTEESPGELFLVTRDIEGIESSSFLQINEELRAHILVFEELQVSTRVDDEIYFPGALLSIWVTGVHDQKVFRMSLPPGQGDYSFSGDGQSEDIDLANWARKLFALAKRVDD